MKINKNDVGYLIFSALGLLVMFILTLFKQYNFIIVSFGFMFGWLTYISMLSLKKYKFFKYDIKDEGIKFEVFENVIAITFIRENLIYTFRKNKDYEKIKTIAVYNYFNYFTNEFKYSSIRPYEFVGEKDAKDKN